MDQFGSDMSIYTRMVCDTIVTTVPKAIVHAMVGGGGGGGGGHTRQPCDDKG